MGFVNDEVIAVNRPSSNNRQLFRSTDGLVAWVADVPRSSAKYLAVFNLPAQLWSAGFEIRTVSFYADKTQPSVHLLLFTRRNTVCSSALGRRNGTFRLVMPPNGNRVPARCPEKSVKTPWRKELMTRRGAPYPFIDPFYRK